MERVNITNKFENSVKLLSQLELVVEKMRAINNERVFRTKWTEINLNKVAQSYGRHSVHLVCIL